jgi:hypothetical protein
VRPGDKTQIAIDATRPATLYGLAFRFPDKAPAAGYRCQVGRTQTTTDTRGAFTLTPVAPGAVEISCDKAPGYAHGIARITAKAGGNDVRVEVVEGATRDSLGAKLVPGADPTQRIFADVVPGGAAATAGVSDGDVLVSVAGVVASPDTAANYLATRPAGTSTSFRIRPKAGSVVVDLTLTPK